MSKLCDCIARVNVHLKEKNARILVNLFGEPHATITLSKIDEKKRTRLPIMMASYCPFCGTPYEVAK